MKRFILPGLLLLALLTKGYTQTTPSLQEMGSNLNPQPVVTIFTAKEIITLDPKTPKANAVAVVNGKVLAVGTLEDVRRIVGKQETITTRRPNNPYHL